MTMLPDIESLFLLDRLLEWVKLLVATHLGFRFVRAYAHRPRQDSTEHALQRRVHELEQETEALTSHLQQVLEAERFAVALLLRRAPDGRTPSAGDGEPAALSSSARSREG